MKARTQTRNITTVHASARKTTETVIKPLGLSPKVEMSVMVVAMPLDCGRFEKECNTRTRRDGRQQAHDFGFSLNYVSIIDSVLTVTANKETSSADKCEKKNDMFPDPAPYIAYHGGWSKVQDQLVPRTVSEAATDCLYILPPTCFACSICMLQLPRGTVLIPRSKGGCACMSRPSVGFRFPSPGNACILHFSCCYAICRDWTS